MFFSGARALSMGVLVMRGSQILLLLAVLRGSEPAGYGQFAMASALVVFALLVAEGGVLQAATSRPHMSESEERALTGYAWLSGAVVYAFLGIASLVVSLLPEMEGVLGFGLVLGLGVIVASPAAVSTGRLQRLGHYQLLAKFQLLASIASLLVGFGLWATNTGVVALVVQSVLSQLLMSAFSLCSPLTRIRPAVDLARARDVRRSANYALLANIFGAVGRRVDDLAVGVVLGPAALGQYSLGYRVLTVVTEVVLQPSERVALQRLASLKASDPSATQHLYRRSRNRLLAVAIPAFTAAGLSAYVGVPFVLGPEWAQAAWIALILTLAGAIQSTYWLTYSTLFALSSPRRALHYQMSQVLILVLGLLVGLLGGTVGVAAGYAAATCLVGIVAHATMWRLLRSNDVAHGQVQAAVAPLRSE